MLAVLRRTGVEGQAHSTTWPAASFATNQAEENRTASQSDYEKTCYQLLVGIQL